MEDLALVSALNAIADSMEHYLANIYSEEPTEGTYRLWLSLYQRLERLRGDDAGFDDVKPLVI